MGTTDKFNMKKVTCIVFLEKKNYNDWIQSSCEEKLRST